MPSETPPTQRDEAVASYLRSQWDPSQVRGYGPSASLPEAARMPLVADSIDEVGAPYPSIVVTFGSETPGGQSGFTFLTDEGAGQDLTGTIVVTARAEDRDDGYSADAGAYPAADAAQLVTELIQHATNLINERPTGADDDFTFSSAARRADAPDDTDQEPIVRQAQTVVTYGARWSP